MAGYPPVMTVVQTNQSMTLVTPRRPGRPPRHPVQQLGGPRASRQRARSSQVRCGVQQAEDRVHGGPGRGLRQGRVRLAHDLHPQLDVLPLELSYELAVAVAEAVQLAVVQGDQRAVVEREVDVPLDERVEDRLGVPVRLRHPPLATREQLPADPHQQFGEHRVLAREVPVQTGAADADRRSYLVHPDAMEAALGEQPGGLLQDLLASGGGVGSRGHGSNSRQGG